ncbi:MAG: hypothetical protein VX764_06480 [Planctomycetota bacterium]|nr:hypothetical protein [Planctomycetota bacterium]
MNRSIIQRPVQGARQKLRELFSFSTPQFVVLLLGVAMLVISSVHMPRRERSQELEMRLQSLKNQEVVLSERIEVTHSQLRALDNDRFYRREALRQMTGQNLRGERTLREHLNPSSSDGRHLRASQ